MKITVMVAMAAMVGIMNARAEQKVVVVYMQDDSVVPGPVLNRAQLMAGGMFAAAGVHIQWRGHTPISGRFPARAVAINFASGTSAGYLPGALAFSLPYEGVHLTVFWDRVARRTSVASTAAVLAHVLVHEITHILQGIDLHSDSGVMKARWTADDYERMDRKPLSLTPEDVLRIRHGLEVRESRRASAKAIAEQ